MYQTNYRGSRFRDTWYHRRECTDTREWPKKKHLITLFVLPHEMHRHTRMTNRKHHITSFVSPPVSAQTHKDDQQKASYHIVPPPVSAQTHEDVQQKASHHIVSPHDLEQNSDIISQKKNHFDLNQIRIRTQGNQQWGRASMRITRKSRLAFIARFEKVLDARICTACTGGAYSPEDTNWSDTI